MQTHLARTWDQHDLRGRKAGGTKVSGSRGCEFRPPLQWVEFELLVVPRPLQLSPTENRVGLARQAFQDSI